MEQKKPKRFGKQSELIKYAINKVIQRTKPKKLSVKKIDELNFLQYCKMGGLV